MAENLSALELVPRGVEGTGKATILGNEQTLNSLARLSGRLDNLQKLRAYTAAKVAAARQPKPTTPDKGYTGGETYAVSGIFGDVVSADNAKDFDEILAVKPKLDYTQQADLINRFSYIQRQRQTYADNQQAQLASVLGELDKAGIVINNDDVQAAKQEYLGKALNDANAEAAKNNISDPKQIDKLRQQILYNPNNNFAVFFRNRVLPNVNKYDRNKLGQLVLDNVGNTSYTYKGAQGAGTTLTKDNIFEQVKTPQGTEFKLNTDLVAAVAKATPYARDMFNNLTNAFIISATNQSSRATDAEKAAARAFYQVGYDITQITDQAQKDLLEKEVIPRAESAAAQNIMAGKGQWNYVVDNDTRKQATNVVVNTGEQKGNVTSSTPITATLTGVSYNPATRKVVPVKGKLSGSYNLGTGKTTTLDSGNFAFSSGTTAYYSGIIPENLLSMLATQQPDGSYKLKVTPKTNTVTVMENGFNISSIRNPIQFKLDGGSVGYYKPGTIVPADMAGGKLIGGPGQYVIVDGQSLLENFSQKTKEEFLKAPGFDELKFFIKLSDNPGVKNQLTAKLGNYGGGPPSNTSTDKMK